MADFEYIYADLTNGNAVTPGGQAASFNWVAGQTVKYAVKFRQTSSAGTQEDISPTILNLRAAVGREGKPPESGWYKVKIGAQPISAANSTGRLDWSADAIELEQALNAIASGPKDFECDQHESALLIRRKNGEDFQVSAISDGLRPSCYSKIIGGQRVRKTRAKLDLGPVRFSALKEGQEGNAISIEYIKPPGIGALSVNVISERVIINLETKAVISSGAVVGYDVATSHDQIVAAINANALAVALVEAKISPQFVNSASNPALGGVARTHLSGGFNGSGYEYSLEFTQAPVVFSDWAGSELPPMPSIQKIQAGGRTPGFPVIKWPTIQAIYVPADFEGVYQLTRDINFKRSGVLTKDDTIVKIKSVVNEMMADEGGVVKVTNPSNNIAHLEFGGDLNGYDVKELGVAVYSSPPPVLSFSLNLDNIGVMEMLRENESVTLPFELDATVWVDSKDPTKGTRVIKIWKKTATIRRNLLWDSMATRPPINWQSSASPVDYVPFSRGQFITGQQASYVTSIGGANNSVKNFSIAHNLGQVGGEGVVAVVVRENVAGGRQLRDDEYELYFTSGSVLEIAFNNPPLTSLAVFIIGYGDESAFVIHTHPIDQIKTINSDGSLGESLRVILDDFNRRISRLENLLPRVGGLPSGMQKKKVSLPVVGEILPDVLTEGAAAGVTISSQIVASQSPKSKPPEPIAGTEADEQRKALQAEVEKLKAEALVAKDVAKEAAEKAAEEFKKKTEQEQASKINSGVATITLGGHYVFVPSVTPGAFKSTYPVGSAYEAPGGVHASIIYPAMRGAKQPMLLPAVHAGVPQNAATVPTVFASGLYLNSGTLPLSLPGGGGRKTQIIQPGSFFAGDGRAYYSVRRNGLTNSYHPIEMERDLVRVLIQESQFPIGSELKLSWVLDFGFDTNSVLAGAGYTMIVRAFPVPDAVVPAVTGANVGAIGGEVLLGKSRISLSRKAIEKRKFSLSLKKTNSERSYEFSDYAKSVGNGFPVGNFLLNIRLEQWDVDDNTPIPTGQVAVYMPDTLVSIEKI
jgi:hypothetical protein